MRMEIAARLRPYSHLPGTFAILPGSALRLQIFPALVRIDDLSGSFPVPLAELSLEIQGPLADFTVQQDLEKGCVVVSGRAKNGFLRYHMQAAKDGKGIMWTIDKAPQGNLPASIQGAWILAGDVSMRFIIPAKTDLSTLAPYLPIVAERLSLGSHKAQDWALMQRRMQMEEIFPIWHRLGQMVPTFTATSATFAHCQKAIEANAPEKILEPFCDIFLAGFDPGLSPRLTDTDHQGIAVDLSAKESPLRLLSEGAQLIRSLFIKQKGQVVHLLPSLPTEFHCGRLLGAACGKSGTLNMEWTKKAIRRATFSANENQQLAFVFYGGKSTCRLRTSYKDRGVKYNSGTTIDIIAEQNYWFDTFQK